MYAFHFIAAGGKLRDASPAANPGGVETYAGDLVICHSGLHGSWRPIDALRYAPGPVIRLFEPSGIGAEQEDKFVCSERRILWAANIDAELYRFACDEGERALLAAGNPDPRSLHAINVRRSWLTGKATDAELHAATTAAGAAYAAARAVAAYTVVYAAKAAYAAANAGAAYAAARAVAHAVAHAVAYVTYPDCPAIGAAHTAERGRQNDRLLEILKAKGCPL